MNRDTTAVRLATIALILFAGWLTCLLGGAPTPVGWAFLAASAAAALFAAVCSWDQARAWLDKQVECRHTTRHLAAEDQAMHIVSDVCGPNTPCSFEDNYLCIWHRTPPHVYVGWDHCERCFTTFESFSRVPEYGPEPVIGRCSWADEMEKRFAE